MSDTPETDALREAIDNGKAAESEMTSLAGKLERERDEARLQYSTTLVFCQSLVKARLEQMETGEHEIYV